MALMRTCGSASRASRESTANACEPSESAAADRARPRAISALMRAGALRASVYGGSSTIEFSARAEFIRTDGEDSSSIRPRTPAGARVRAMAYDAAQTIAGDPRRSSGATFTTGTGRSFAAASSNWIVTSVS